MAIKDGMLPEFDMEVAATRRVLAGVPDDKFDYKPHEKNFSMGQLASHIVNLMTWATITIKQDSLDVQPVDGEPFTTPQAASQAQLLEWLDTNAAEARAALDGCDDERMMKNWRLLGAGKEFFSMPRVACLRGFVMNHMIHHRAQLGLYLRLADVPVPQTYGPTADDTSM